MLAQERQFRLEGERPARLQPAHPGQGRSPGRLDGAHQKPGVRRTLESREVLGDRPSGRRACRPRARAGRPRQGRRPRSSWSPSRRGQGGRSKRSRGTPTVRQAASAWRPIRAAKGWLASTSRSRARTRRNRARPSAPPKPPLRTSPGRARGARVRPASELITSRSRRVAQASASATASLVPARIRTFMLPAARAGAPHQPLAWPISRPSRSKIITSSAQAPSSAPSATRRALSATSSASGRPMPCASSST